MMADSNVSEELKAISSKRASLKDKMKRRREAIGSILSQATSLTVGTPSSSSAIVSKKNEVNVSASTSSVKLDKEKEKNKDMSPTTFDLPPANKRPTSTEKDEDVLGKITRNGSDSVSVISKSNEKSASSSRAKSSDANDDILSLLSKQTAKEKEDQRHRNEILELLSRPTAKEQTLMDTFRSQSGAGVKKFCTHSTKEECMKFSDSKHPCDKLHFVRIIQPHTDETLGDCSFLNTCFHMDTCKYIHYKVDEQDIKISSAQPHQGDVQKDVTQGHIRSRHLLETLKLVPPQWVQCDLRNLKLSVLGKFSVVMADPPWDIHMELPYGTMSDDEMRQLPVRTLQDEGLIFLWVTGRAMELGRDCLKLWGYERVDELIWVKTNQLQRIIRTGRTGHWLNHGKEHCLVGRKGQLKLNRGLDCDVIVAEVRATSHKPDEIYGIIERLSPGTRKIELFGRPHNVQPNWVTLGNQLDGIVIHDEEVLSRWHDVYPDGYEFVEGVRLHPRKEP